MNETDNNTWECWLCGKDEGFENLPSGYLINLHPLCEECADEVLIDEEHRQHARLSYHKDVGDILFL